MVGRALDFLTEPFGSASGPLFVVELRTHHDVGFASLTAGMINAVNIATRGVKAVTASSQPGAYSVGLPASFHALNPPSRWATRS